MNNKLLYCHLHNIDNVGKGIKNKIFAQLKGFEDMGYQVTFLTLSNKGININNTIQPFSRSAVIQRIYGPIKAAKIFDKNQYDVMYVRGFGIDYSLLFFLRQARKKVNKIIFEFPTFPYTHELKGEGFLKNIYYYIDKSCNIKLKKYVDQCVNFDIHKEIFGIPSTPISNAIDIDKIDYIGNNSELFSENKLNILGVASLRFYHGFDRVIKGLSNYYKNSNNVNVHFHVVGDGDPELSKLKSMSSKLNLDKHITFYGRKYDKELTEVFKKANVGVASLGMHRNGLDNGSVLKVREYFSRGLPFLISYNDLHINNYSKFYLKLSPDDSPVDIKKIIEWAFKNPINTNEMRLIAEKEFKWKNQFKKIPFLKDFNN